MRMNNDLKADKTLNIEGLSDIRSGQVAMDTLDKMTPGQILKVITRDYKSKKTLPLLCENSGYRLLSIKEEGGYIYLTIQK